MLTTAALAATLAIIFPPDGGGPRGSLPLLQATVSDPLSHGQLGDGLLSLNEAIQLHNQTVALSQLSAAELAQLALLPGTGFAPAVSRVRLDAAITPTITVQQDLEVVLATTHGLVIAADNGRVALDFSGPTISQGLRSTSDSLHVVGMIFSGGRYGIEVDQTDTTGLPGLVVEDCEFEDHSQFGVRVGSLMANAAGSARFERCRFDDVAVGVLWDGSTAGRRSTLVMQDCRLTDVGSGIEAFPGSGGQASYVFDRVLVETAFAGIRGIYIGRLGSRPLTFVCQHVDVRAQLGIGLITSPATQSTGDTILSMRMVNVIGAPAMMLGGNGEHIGGILHDSNLRGGVRIRTGTGSTPLELRNVRCPGAVSLATSPGQSLMVHDSRFDGGPVSFSGGGTAMFLNCCFVGATLGATVGSSVICSDCYLASAGANVTALNPRPGPQLGNLSVQPLDPAVGATLTYQPELPQGLFGFCLLGFTDPTPTLIFGQSLYLYSQLNNTWAFPGTFRLQQPLTWSVPAVSAFVGIDLVAQLAVLPDPNVNAPPLQLPPGRRFVLQ